MYNADNQPRIGLITNVHEETLKGYKPATFDRLAHEQLCRVMTHDPYPYSYVVVWYGKDVLNINEDSYLCLAPNALADYGINLDCISIPYSMIEYKPYTRDTRSTQLKHELSTSKYSFGKNSLINDEITLDYQREMDCIIKGRGAKNIYKGDIPQLEFDNKRRSRKGSWKDTKVRYQWQKKAQNNKLFRTQSKYDEELLVVE